MRHCSGYDWIDSGTVVLPHPPDEPIEACFQMIAGRGGNETRRRQGVAVRRSAGPLAYDHLGVSQPPRTAGQWCAPHQYPVEILQESRGNRAAISDPSEPVVGHSLVVQDFNEIQRRGFICVSSQHLPERSVGTLQRGGSLRLAA